MRAAELLDAALAERGEREPHNPLIGRIGVARHESRRLRAVDEADRAVVLEEERLRHVAHRRAVRVPAAPDRE